MKTIAIIAAALCLSACVTAPTDPAQLAAWNTEKTARTLARRPEAGSVLPGKAPANPEAFEDLKESHQPAKVSEVWQ